MGLFDLFQKGTKSGGKIRFVFEVKTREEGCVMTSMFANGKQLLEKQLLSVYKGNLVFFTASEWSGSVYPDIHHSEEQQSDVIQAALASIIAKGYDVKSYDISQSSFRNFQGDMYQGMVLFDMIVTLE